MERIRVVVAMQAGLACDMVTARLAAEPDIDLVTTDAHLDDLDDSAFARRRTVIVLTSTGGALPEFCAHLLVDHRVGIVAVAADERTARMIEIRETEIARLEPGDVLAAIRAMAIERTNRSTESTSSPASGTRPSLHPI